MGTPEFTEFIKDSGGCLVSRNIIDGRGHITWARREKPVNPVDNGWRILSDADTDDGHALGSSHACNAARQDRCYRRWSAAARCRDKRYWRRDNAEEALVIRIS